MRLRQIAPVGLVLALTLAGFFGARAFGERDARHDSERRADVAAAEIRAHVVQGAALAESLRRFMVGAGGGGVTNEQFEAIASSWLSPAGLSAAAWVEPVPASRRATYERRIGRPIVMRDRRGTVAPVSPRPSYLPATLVSGIAPMVVVGLDLGSESGVAAAVDRERTLFDVSATPLVRLRDGTSGFFLAKSAQRLGRGAVEPGFVVLFLPDSWLRAAATGTQRSQLTVGGISSGDLEGVPAVQSGFAEAGQRFEVAVPRRPVNGAAAVMPWIILATGFALALLVGALGINGARRASARRELDRIFSLSHDLITVADFDGHFSRVNPAVESILGYTEEEFLSRPYLDFVHPDDRERTAAEAAGVRRGQKTVWFENRFVRKDGSHRWLEWAATPVVEERAMYGVARDVTERRQAETDLRAAEKRNRTLAEEQAALRRVATLVARGVPPDDLFDAVTEEAGQLLPVSSAMMGRYEPDGMVTTVASWAAGVAAFPVGGQWIPEGRNVMTMVFETGRPARVDDFADASDAVGVTACEARLRSAVGSPIIVDGHLWGVMTAASSAEQPLPAGTEARLASFTELVAVAIANAEGRAELTASRARIVTASDDTRRRIERDLHDGAQQRLVVLGLELRAAGQRAPSEIGELTGDLSRFADDVQCVLDDLREMSRGIHPAILAEGGLAPALKTLARRARIPVEVDVRVKTRLPAPVEVAAYYAVSEALTNAIKHAQASVVRVTLDENDGMFQLSIRDDGIGGADVRKGSGLIGLYDRVEALGGSIELRSPPGDGTLIVVTFPLETAETMPSPVLDEVHIGSDDPEDLSLSRAH